MQSRWLVSHDQRPISPRFPLPAGEATEKVCSGPSPRLSWGTSIGALVLGFRAAIPSIGAKPLGATKEAP